MKSKGIIANPKHQVAYNDIVKLVSKHSDKLMPMELLAIASNMVGKLLAMQDQRIITPQMGMELIAKNIEIGNRQVIEDLKERKPEGSA